MEGIAAGLADLFEAEPGPASPRPRGAEALVEGITRRYRDRIVGELVVPAAYVPVPASITAHVAIWLPAAGYDFPDALLCLLMSGWARIHGMVMLELFEHLPPVVGDAAAFYRYELDAFLQLLGLTTTTGDKHD